MLLESDETNFPNVDEDDDLKETIRNKLKSGKANRKSSKKVDEIVKESNKVEEVVQVSDSDSDDLKNELEKERRIKKKKKAYIIYCF